MCNSFVVYFQIFKTFGYKKLKNSDSCANSYGQFLLRPSVPIRRCHRKNIRVARCDTWPPGGCICLARDVGPVCYFTDSESAAALAASHAAPAL